MKQVIIISIQPQWVQKILSGQKTIEIRKTIPKCELPIDVYIYCTYNKNPKLFYIRNFNVDGKEEILMNGKIVAKFTLNRIESYDIHDATMQAFGVNNRLNDMLKDACLTVEELDEYTKRNPFCLAWYIDNLVIFDKPMELGEFQQVCKYRVKTFVTGCSRKHKCAYEKERECIRTITRPPQSWFYAYVKGE